MSTSTEELAAIVASLPAWDTSLDDDPNWMRPVTDFGFEKVPSDHPTLLAASGTAGTADWPTMHAVDLDPTLIRYAGQPFLNLGVLHAYVTDRDTPVDPDAWYGQPYPVVTPHDGGYAVLDGCHRVAADRIAGRLTRAYVIPA